MQKLLNKNIIYVTRDIERATGFDLSNPNYYIISNSSTFAKQIAKDKNNILLIEAEKQIDTWELLEKTESKNYWY